MGENLLPVWMRRRQHELEVHSAGSILQLVMLDAIELVGDVRPANIHLKVETEQVILTQ